VDDGVTINVLDTGHDALFELLLGCYPDVAQDRAAGEWITASGEWVNDRTHGHQFKARFLRTSTPTSADGIEKYLSSGMIRGVVLMQRGTSPFDAMAKIRLTE